MNRRRLITTALATASSVSIGRTALAQTPESGAETREIDDVRGTQVIPANPKAVVSLGEEFLLADLLELGIKPIAAAGNFVEEYVGIDPALTEGLEPFTLWELDVESVSNFETDLILVPEVYYTSQSSSYDLLSQLAPLVVIPTNPEWQSNFAFLASVFGMEDIAAEKIAEIESLTEEARAELGLDGQTATYATIYPGASEITLWLTEQLPIVEMGITLGLTVVPDFSEFETDQIGRARVSLEQLHLMQGETLFMLQTTGGISPDEDASYQELVNSTAFQGLPAVQTDSVQILERVGFPGDIPGRRNLLARYREIFAVD